MASAKIYYDKIKKLRNEFDFTQADLEHFSGVNVNIIKQVESGRSGTSKENMVAIAETLKVPLEDLYNEHYRETKVVTVLNSKGGCGKTSVVQNLGYELSLMKDLKILIVDADLQCNLTDSFSMKFDVEKSIYKAIMMSNDDYNPSDIDDYITKTMFDNLDMVISDYNMATIELDMSAKHYRETLISTLFNPVIEKGKYDYIVFDCNPMLGLLNQNILHITDHVIIPVELSPFGISGLSVLFKFIEKAKRRNPKLSVMGLLRTKVDKRYSMTKKAEEGLRELLASMKFKMFDTYIPTDSNIEKSQWTGFPLRKYVAENNKYSRANKAFYDVAKEVVANARQ